MKFYYWIAFIGCFISRAYGDILIVGDSHTVGPFGSIVHRELANHFPQKVIALYGHSSSAPVHWMSDTPIKLSGGINHQVSFQNLLLTHPQLPDWRTPQNSLSLKKVLENPLLHSQWRVQIPYIPRAQTIIIALGANDRHAVSTPTGQRTREFEKRVKVAQEMIQLIEAQGAKCIWIGPPSSAKLTREIEQTTQDYLEEAIGNRCAYFDSRAYLADSCDKVHFSCPQGIPKAREWARSVTTFLLHHL